MSVVAADLKCGTVEIYTYMDYDSAFLGFAVLRKGEGRRGYYPLYCSTYRGLPNGQLTILIPEDAPDEFWIGSSWKGYETLAHYDGRQNVCHSEYGIVGPSESPDADGAVDDSDDTPLPDCDFTQSGRKITVRIVNRGKRLEVE